MTDRKVAEIVPNLQISDQAVAPISQLVGLVPVVCSTLKAKVVDMLTEQILTWILDVYGRGSEVVAAEPLYSWRPGAPLLVQVKNDNGTHNAILRSVPTGPGWHPIAARVVAALTAAEQFGVPAPRVIAADISGSDTGDPAILESVLPGTSMIPREASTPRLRALGEITGSLYFSGMTPSDDLGFLTEPIDVGHASADRRRALRFERATPPEQAATIEEFRAEHDCSAEQARQQIAVPVGGRSELLEHAEDRLSTQRAPDDHVVLVHGDLWQGNILWVSDQPSGMVDWDASGTGHPGIDLGTVRLDAAIMFGLEAPRNVLAGWRSATGYGSEPHDLAYWDIRAALNTPATMAPPVHHQYGRSDLDSTTAAARRDDFLRDALRHWD